MNEPSSTNTDNAQTGSDSVSAKVPRSAVPLNEIPAGQSGVVVRIDDDDHAMLIRLKTMGMHEGRAVRVIRRGARVIVSCGGTRIGLSAEVARHVLAMPTES